MMKYFFIYHSDFCPVAPEAAGSAGGSMLDPDT